MTKTPTTQPETLGFTQKLARADSEIARLIAQEKQAALQLQADQADLQSLQTQAEAHDLQKQTIQETIDARRSALREAEAQAAISEGTIGEKPDVKNLEKLLKQAQQEQLVILDRIGKEEQAQERRRCALSDSVDRHYHVLNTLAENREAMEAAKTRVWEEFGQAEYNRHLQKLNAFQTALSAAEQAIQQARDEIDTYAKEATNSLQNWPELQVKFTFQTIYEDPLTHILDSAISFIETVLAEGRGAEIPWEVSQQLHMQFMGLSELVSIDPLYLRPAFRIDLAADVGFLEERKGQIEAILAAHRAWKQGVK